MLCIAFAVPALGLGHVLLQAVRNGILIECHSIVLHDGASSVRMMPHATCMRQRTPSQGALGERTTGMGILCCCVHPPIALLLANIRHTDANLVLGCLRFLLHRVEVLFCETQPCFIHRLVCELVLVLALARRSKRPVVILAPLLPAELLVTHAAPTTTCFPRLLPVERCKLSGVKAGADVNRAHTREARKVARGESPNLQFRGADLTQARGARALRLPLAALRPRRGSSLALRRHGT